MSPSAEAPTLESSLVPPDGWLAVESIGGDSWIVPAEPTSSEAEADAVEPEGVEAIVESIEAAKPASQPQLDLAEGAQSDTEPEWLTDAQELVDSPPPIRRERRREQVQERDAYSSEAASQLPWMAPLARRSTARLRLAWKPLVLVLLFSLCGDHLNIRHRLGSAIAAATMAKTHSALAQMPAYACTSMMPVMMDEHNGGTCAAARDGARHALASKLEDLAAQRSAEKQELEDALMRSDAALSEARHRFDEVREAYHKASQELSAIKAQKPPVCPTPVPSSPDEARFGTEERRELLEEARGLVKASEKARKQEREAWQRRLGERQQQIEVMREAYHQVSQELSAIKAQERKNEDARKKEREAWQRRVRDGVRDGARGGVHDEEQATASPKAHGPRRRGRHGHGHGHAPRRSSWEAAKEAADSARAEAAAAWQASLDAWQGSMEGWEGRAWPFTSFCHGRAAGNRAFA